MACYAISDSSSFLLVSDSVDGGAEKARTCSYIETIGIVIRQCMGRGKLSQPYLASLP